MTPRSTALAVALATIVSLTAACGGSQSAGGSTPTPITPSRSAALTAAIDQLPADLRASGRLRFATADIGPPGVYPDAHDHLTGWEIELATLAAEELGLEAQFTTMPFAALLPSVAAQPGTSAIASIFDTVERQKQVQFVGYYRGGTLWARAAASKITPNAACGATVATIAGTYQANIDLPSRSADCVKAGSKPITIRTTRTIAEAAEEVLGGKAQAMVGDSPTIIDRVTSSRNQLVTTGDIYDLYYYGMPVANGDAALATALQEALMSLKVSGRYDRLLGKWGVEDGALTTFPINGATS